MDLNLLHLLSFIVPPPSYCSSYYVYCFHSDLFHSCNIPSKILNRYAHDPGLGSPNQVSRLLRVSFSRFTILKVSFSILQEVNCLLTILLVT